MTRVGTYVSSPKGVLIVIVPPIALVQDEPVSKLGFEHGEALSNSQAFAGELNLLGNKVSEQLKLVYPASDEEKLDKALHLDDETCWDTLHQLSKIGRGMRITLSPELLSKFAYNGFHFLENTDIEEPEFTFQEGDATPILWEMLYECDSRRIYDDRGWEAFWGFRVPITHWLHEHRSEVILLHNGLFSAINEDLPFAHDEVTQLERHLGPNLFKYRLADELRQRIMQEMQVKMHEDDLKSWWTECGGGPWLQLFLQQLEPDSTKWKKKITFWKEEALVSICKKGFHQELIHFACHCVVDKKTAFLSRLIMKIAGEEVLLDVSMIASDGLGRERVSPDEPGSLVFLNACGTGELNSAYEPPGFPVKWIRNQRAQAVIATLCPIPDYFAHAFAMQFYKILFTAINAEDKAEEARNRHIARALLETRRYFMENYNNPLGLAYVLYAVRGARIQYDALHGGHL